MKNFKLKFLPMLAVVIVFSTASCEKESIMQKKESTSKLSLEIRPTINCDRVGEEDEEEIIAGKIEDANQVAIADATIDLLNSSDSTLIGSDTSDSQGKFDLSAPAGGYLFRVIKGGSAPSYSNPFQLIENVQVIIQL